MSTRPAVSAPVGTPVAAVDRLAQVLSAGLRKLTLDAEDTGPYGGGKRSAGGDAKSNVETLGLALSNTYFPATTITSDTTAKLLGPRLSTVTLRRSNKGQAPGVVFDNYSTVLIISADSRYTGNRYLSFLNAVRAGTATADLPNIEYDFPVPQKKQDAPSTYVKKAGLHLFDLVKQATLESIGQSDFTHDYEQALSKIYLFFKRPVSGADVQRTDGPYIYFGRFKAMPDKRLITSYGGGPPSFDRLNTNRVKSIRLRAFDTPVPPASIPVSLNTPTNMTKINEADLDMVVRLLQRLTLYFTQEEEEEA